MLSVCVFVCVLANFVEPELQLPMSKFTDSLLVMCPDNNVYEVVFLLASVHARPSAVFRYDVDHACYDSPIILTQPERVPAQTHAHASHDKN